MKRLPIALINVVLKYINSLIYTKMKFAIYTCMIFYLIFELLMF